jgi:hypothetical protein
LALIPGAAPDATDSEAAPDRASPAVAAAAGTAILLVALGSLAYSYSQGLINTYGDSIAHMEGARRLFDSQTPGYAEIGTVWLPLFHVLASPLALSDFLWRTGLGGAIVSSVAFIIAAWLIFRLALGMNRDSVAAVVALAAFLLCPDMDYLASTPLTEPLNIMWFVLMVYGLFRFQQSQRHRALAGASVAGLFGTLTRYDLWYVLPFAALFVLLAKDGPWSGRFKHAALFSVIAGAGPVLWLVHNALRFGDMLEFYNGPFSAKAIYAHQAATTGFRYPTDGSLVLSAHYFLADLELVIGVWPLALALLGLVAWAAERREQARRAAGLLFLVPLPFYLQSMAHAAVPLYVPTLFPNTYYNLRYGLEMLPAVAVGCSFLVSSRLGRRLRLACGVLLVALIAAQAAANLSAGVRELPVVKEGLLNNPCRSKAEQTVIRVLRGQYDGRLILMTVGKWPCVMPTLDIPFRKTLTESNRESWLGLRFGADSSVGWIVRGDGDSVDELMRRYPEAFKNFELVEREKSPGEDGVSIYRRKML